MSSLNSSLNDLSSSVNSLSNRNTFYDSSGMLLNEGLFRLVSLFDFLVSQSSDGDFLLKNWRWNLLVFLDVSFKSSVASVNESLSSEYDS